MHGIQVNTQNFWQKNLHTQCITCICIIEQQIKASLKEFLNHTTYILKNKSSYPLEKVHVHACKNQLVSNMGNKQGQIWSFYYFVNLSQNIQDDFFLIEGVVSNSLYPCVEGHPKYYFSLYFHVPTTVPLFQIFYCSNLDILGNMIYEFEG